MKKRLGGLDCNRREAEESEESEVRQQAEEKVGDPIGRPEEGRGREAGLRAGGAEVSDERSSAEVIRGGDSR